MWYLRLLQHGLLKYNNCRRSKTVRNPGNLIIFGLWPQSVVPYWLLLASKRITFSIWREYCTRSHITEMEHIIGYRVHNMEFLKINSIIDPRQYGTHKSWINSVFGFGMSSAPPCGNLVLSVVYYTNCRKVLKCTTKSRVQQATFPRPTRSVVVIIRPQTKCISR